MRDKRAKYRRWAVVYILLALLMAAVLALLMAAGVYKSLVGVLCMVVGKCYSISYSANFLFFAFFSRSARTLAGSLN